MNSARIIAAIWAEPTKDFTAADWVLLALAALDQAAVTPDQLARAYRFGRGKEAAVLDELDLASEES